MKKTITITENRDLIEIEAHYFHHFTATADQDLDQLLNFLKTYIKADDEYLPDLSLSVYLDKNMIVKNLSLDKLDVHKCSAEILADALDIIAVLGLTALKRTKKKFDINQDKAICSAIDDKINSCINLKNILLKEHNIQDVLQQDIVEIQ